MPEAVSKAPMMANQNCQLGLSFPISVAPHDNRVGADEIRFFIFGVKIAHKNLGVLNAFVGQNPFNFALAIYECVLAVFWIESAVRNDRLNIETVICLGVVIFAKTLGIGRRFSFDFE